MFSKSDPKSQFRSKGLEPYHSAEEHQHGQSHAEPDQPKKGIPVRPFHLRHVLVIHPADANEASQRDENGGSDGQPVMNSFILLLTLERYTSIIPRPSHVTHRPCFQWWYRRFRLCVNGNTLHENKRLQIQAYRACERSSANDFQMHGEFLRCLGFSRLQTEVYMVLGPRQQRSNPRIHTRFSNLRARVQRYGIPSGKSSSNRISREWFSVRRIDSRCPPLQKQSPALFDLLKIFGEDGSPGPRRKGNPFIAKSPQRHPRFQQDAD